MSDIESLDGDQGDVLNSNEPQDDHNSIKYVLYTSKPVNEDLIQCLKQHVKSLLPSSNQLDLKLKTKPNFKKLCYGQVKFDQKFELEWLVIYCLIELSKFNSDLVIKVSDKDGDVLLIEAAEHLPRWLESKLSKNRVFIHQGKVHIIPRDVDLNNLREQASKENNNSKNMAVCPLAELAAKFIRDNNLNSTSVGPLQQKASLVPKKRSTLASPSIQDSIREKLAGMPDTELWLNEKFKQLDQIISGGGDLETDEKLERSFINSLNLNNVMEMDELELEISPISSLLSSPASKSRQSSFSNEQEGTSDGSESRRASCSSGSLSQSTRLRRSLRDTKIN